MKNLNHVITLSFIIRVELRSIGAPELAVSVVLPESWSNAGVECGIAAAQRKTSAHGVVSKPLGHGA